MDSAEQLRILERAKGHPARLALATVDLVHSHLPEEERTTLKVALKAASVPHWIDEHILAILLSIEEANALGLLVALRNLNVVENFPARGERAANVHEATRKAIRKMTREEDPELFQSFSKRAREGFGADKSFHMRIEALYHLFAVDQEAAAIECSRLDNEATTVAGPQYWSALAAMLNELLTEKWLRGHALLQAILSVNECKLNRGDTVGVESAAREAAALATELNDWRGRGRAHGVLGDLRILQADLGLALQEFTQALTFYERVVLEYPQNLDWQRERNVFYSRIGDVLLRQTKLDEALTVFRKKLAGSKAIVSKDSNIAGAEREVGIAHLKIGDVYAQKLDFVRALAQFHETRKIAEELAAKQSDNPEAKRDLGFIYARLGDIFLQEERFEEALTEFEKDLAICRDLINQDPTNAHWRHGHSVALFNVGIALFRLDRRDEAVSHTREAKAEINKIIPPGATSGQWVLDHQNIQEALEAMTALPPETRGDGTQPT